MLIVSAIGGVIYQQKGMPYRYPEELQAIIDNNDPESVINGEKEKITAKLLEGGELPRIGMNNIEPSFILWGDSHARALIPAIVFQANHNGLSGFVGTRNDHPPLLGMDVTTDNMTVTCHHEYNDKVISFIVSHPEIKTVILSAIWEFYAKGYHFNKRLGGTYTIKDVTGNMSSNSNALLLKIGLTRTINKLLSLDRKVVIVSDVPDIGFNVPGMFFARKRIGVSFNDILPSMNEYIERNKVVYEIFAIYKSRPNVTIIYPESMLFDKSGNIIIANSNKLLYQDSHHLSKYGAIYISPVFNNCFKKMALGRI